MHVLKHNTDNNNLFCTFLMIEFMTNELLILLYQARAVIEKCVIFALYIYVNMQGVE